MTGRPFRFVLNHGPQPPAGGLVKRRLAVRALVVRDGRILMVHSTTFGDWKFPGGGVEARETEAEALAREIVEETGYTPRGGFRPAGTAWERSEGREVPGSLFEMESRYFWADVEDCPGAQCLDDYEKDLGFTPGWVTVAEALASNRALAASGRPAQPSWLAREIRVLEFLVTHR